MARGSWLRGAFGPGLLVAATGVGAGDLATGALAGSRLGLAVLWAVALGAAMKWVLSEGLARWQIATGETVLEGALRRLGRPLRWAFLLYLLPWSLLVGSALVSACGVATHALLPVFQRAETGKVVFGVACSLAGWALASRGGWRLFERVMQACVAVMFLTVIVTGALLVERPLELLRGLVVPTVPDTDGALGWTVALIGGVGGTLTVICYGYWLRETGRDGPQDLPLARADLAVGYGATALFGMAMVVVGSGVEVGGSGAGLVVALAGRLGERLGATARALFLLGAWSAVFTSLLGVWQSVPYVFADVWRVARDDPRAVSTSSRPYRLYLAGLALVPLLGLALRFVLVQKLYAFVGALFLPLLALVLLLLNGRASWVGARFRNRWPATLALLAVGAFFLALGVLGL
jgi:Mn2+/Fe2+ NRAMP family transporter